MKNAIVSNTAAFGMHRSVFVRREWKAGTREWMHVELPEVSTGNPNFPVGSAHLPHPELQRSAPDLIEQCILFGFTSLWPLFLQCQYLGHDSQKCSWDPIPSLLRPACISWVWAESFLKNAELECNSVSSDWECHWYGQGGSLAAEERLDF